ncbi:TRAP transporter substrate-binding protein [Hydrogenophaga sp. YM1]|jgi:TRAP-type C4-dicarboxylate transport system substrate-binding protein|uniref:TRAP transporter substrate-binding protein n=1 Tax=Hydrogenophaga TaxID=47420 RepID=UPI000868538D|nr:MULTISPECIES: TRAP transporter substrate-binding protein [unclassified Hydrogenophaga]MBN9373727.1 TRAP transporter substrate-binding protein [Hydrogenophaga sp.]ODT31917.1 MAG: ABC transporter substrate-binding protein [Hydrogenophaga sp. SCN 70-13]OJV51112.1 MAG: ABC transporter substrate-binding protein [Hydrogenophaga sp. 70-12]QRR35633.1 TRAP transporter substrate-binding protein [Hydrogenophaga sp. YM1]
MKLIPLLATAALLSAGAASAQTVFTASSWVPPTHTLSMAQKSWCDLLEKESAGRMKCNILPKSVAAAPGTFDAVRDGLADISYTVDGYTPGRFVFTQLAEFPFLGDSALATSVAYQHLYAKHFAPLGEHRGVKVLAVFTHGPGIIFNSKQPVKTLDDATKLKFRIGGGNINELSKLMGFNTTLKPAPDSFELLSTGVMDGTFFPDESIASFKLNMIKHATTFPGGLYNTSFVFMMNPAKYNALSAQDKAVVDKISGEVATRIFGEGWDKVDAASRELQKAQGVARIQADDSFIKAVAAKQAELEDKWAAAAAAKGLKDPKAVLAEFRAEIKKVK